MMRTQLLTITLALCMLPAAAQAQGKYSLTDLSLLTPEYPTTNWVSINNAGDLAGVGRGLVSYVGGQLTSHEYYNIAQTVRISNSGTITFNAPAAGTSGYHGYKLVNGVATQMTSLDKNWDAPTFINAVNDAGVAVGEADRGWRCTDWGSCGGNEHRAALFGDGTVKDLGVLNQDGLSKATALNNQGAIVGYSSNSTAHGTSFIYENGVMQDLGVGRQSKPVAINDAGQIAGTYWRGQDGDGSWLINNGQVEYFYLDGVTTSAIDLNNAGQVVGNSGNWGSFHAWIRSDGEITLLDELLHEEGWSILAVYDLNDKGQILASARRPDGVGVSVLLTPDEPPVLLPVPEPGSYAMLAAGLGVLALWRRRPTIRDSAGLR